MRVHAALQQTVTSPRWDAWRARVKNIQDREKIDQVKATVLDLTLVRKVKEINKLIWPAIAFLKMVDSNRLVSSKVYYHWFEIHNHVGDFKVKYLANEGSSKAKELVRKWKKNVLDRWNYSMSDFYFAGYMIDPEFQSHSSPDAEVGAAFERMCEKHELDLEAVGVELTKYRGAEGSFGSKLAKASAKSSSPLSWWQTYGKTSAPTLFKLAEIVLDQACTSSSIERVWSTYAFIHDKTRNRLKATRAEKLVKVHYNLRALAEASTKSVSIQGWIPELIVGESDVDSEDDMEVEPAEPGEDLEDADDGQDRINIGGDEEDGGDLSDGMELNDDEN